MTEIHPTPRVAAPATLSPALKAEFETSQFNPCVGDVLVSESDRVRVWSLRLKPGTRIGFHRHVLDYFWTVVEGGKARSHYHDGRVAEVSYKPGDTQHLTFRRGEFMVHDLENIGDSEIVFTTVEFLDSANPPLEVPGAARLAKAA